MMAVTGGGQCHGHILVVGQRVVDGLNVGVGKEFGIGAVGLGDTQRVSHLLRLRQRAGGDGTDVALLALLHGRDANWHCQNAVMHATSLP